MTGLDADFSPELRRAATLRRAVTLRRAWALFGLLLFAVTWRLWTPQHVFPQIPLLDWLGRIGDGWQWSADFGLLAALLTALAAGPRHKMGSVALAAAAVLTGLLVACDQHRLQPWAYQFMLSGMILAVVRPSRALVWLRLLVISIYVYSAWSKIDYTFLHTLGQQFAAAGLKPLGIAVAERSPGVRLALAWLFPLVELAVAVGLSWPPTRRGTLYATLVLHALLIGILGPWGLAHKPAVLVWNVFFMVENWMLFMPAGKDDHGSTQQGLACATRSNWLGVMAELIMAAALLAPLAEAWQWIDSWPAWGLYAPRAERIAVFVQRSAVTDLGRLAQFAAAADDGATQQDDGNDDVWIRLRLDRWSLAALDVPIYPQNRFQLGVAEDIARGHGLDDQIRVVVFSAANRTSGARRDEVLNGLTDIERAAEGYWLNAHPRR